MRLIDADALLKQFSECNFKGYTMQKLIVNAPTIEVPRWIPVSERLPEANVYALVCTPSGVYKSRHCGNGAWQSAGGRWRSVTHWMPLPDAPKDGDT